LVGANTEWVFTPKLEQLSELFEDGGNGGIVHGNDSNKGFSGGQQKPSFDVGDAFLAMVWPADAHLGSRLPVRFHS